MAKLKLNKENNGDKYFNTLDDMRTIIGPDKLIMFTHKAKYVDVIGAKDTGKSLPTELRKIQIQEQDPMASIITLMKYSTNAAKRGTRAFYKALSLLRAEGYKFKFPYEPSTSFMYRMKDKKIKINNQSVEYGSFENSDALAGYVVSNGGYPAMIHIEEPVLQGDTAETVTLNQWNADLKTIEDTVKRHWRDYNLSLRNPDGTLKEFDSNGRKVYEPIPFKIITTMNDWDPEHPVSKRAEKYHPQMEFLDWALGYNYSKLRELWKDKIVDSETMVPELKEWVDARWEDIKLNVLKNHTSHVYIDRDPITGMKEDRLIVRMQKFANPVARNDEATREETYDEMYNALITGDNLGLAKAFGMGFGGTADEEKRFNFKSFKPQDTEKLLKEEGRRVLAFSVGWDHDANRGPVATPVTYSAIAYNKGTPLQPVLGYRDPKVMIHEQVCIEGYGKGDRGQNTKRYHDMMIQISGDLYKKYVTKDTANTFAIFDDDDGSYLAHIANDIIKCGFTFVSALPNKNGRIMTDGFGVPDRDEVWQNGVDVEDIIVDDNNELLKDWLKMVPRTTSASNGDVKRSVKGKWGTRRKDISNSAEYGWWPFRKLLFRGLE